MYGNCQNIGPIDRQSNAPDKTGNTPIHWAALYGHTEIVKILAPLVDNPNAPNDIGETPNLLGSKEWAYRNCQNFNPFDRPSHE